MDRSEEQHLHRELYFFEVRFDYQFASKKCAGIKLCEFWVPSCVQDSWTSENVRFCNAACEVLTTSCQGHFKTVLRRAFLQAKSGALFQKRQANIAWPCGHTIIWCLGVTGNGSGASRQCAAVVVSKAAQGMDCLVPQICPP